MKLRNRIALEIGVVLLLHHSQCFFETISNEHLRAHFAKLSVWKMTFLAGLFACTGLSTLAGYCTKLLSEMNNVTDLDFADVLRDLNFWKPKIFSLSLFLYQDFPSYFPHQCFFLSNQNFIFNIRQQKKKQQQAYRTYLVRAYCEENEVTYSFTYLGSIVHDS